MIQQDRSSERASSSLTVPQLLFLIKRPFINSQKVPPQRFFCVPPPQTHYSGAGPVPTIVAMSS